MTFYILFFVLIIFFAFVIRSRSEKRNAEIKIQKLSREIDSIYKQYNLIANDEVNLSTNPYLIGFLCNTIGLNLINFGFLPQSIDGLKLVERCFNYTNIDFNISEINPDLLKQKGGSFNTLELSKGDLIIMERNRLTIENNQNFIKGTSDSVNFIGVKKRFARSGNIE